MICLAEYKADSGAGFFCRVKRNKEIGRIQEGRCRDLAPTVRYHCPTDGPTHANGRAISLVGIAPV